MGGEDIALLGPELMLTLAVVDDGIGAHDGQGRSEAQGRGRYAVDATLVERIDGDVGRQARFQLQVWVGGGDDHFVGDYGAGAGAGAARRRGSFAQTDLGNFTLERVAGIGIDGKLYTLAQFDAAYIGFIDVGHYLHLRQVGCNGEEGRGFEA